MNLKSIFIVGTIVSAGIGLLLIFHRLAAADAATRHAGDSVELSVGETGRVGRVVDGDTFIMDSGLRVQLSAIQAPQVGSAREQIKALPLAEEARTELTGLIEGETVGLYYGGDARDRYDRAVAQVWVLDAMGEKQLWVQEALVASGFARVYTWPGEGQNTRALYAAERKAREAGTGIWNSSKTGAYFDVRRPDPDPLIQFVDSVQIVEGVIVSAAQIKQVVYLNFGSDYKTDFTIGIPAKTRKNMINQGVDPAKLRGALVRVRGWVEIQNGPIIWLNDPDRLEILN